MVFSISRRSVALALTAVVCGMATVAHAQASLPAPKDRVVLTLGGQIGVRNHGSHAAFDMAMLEALPQHTFTTRTPWDDQPVTFRGPRLRDVLAAVRAEGRQLRATALNDYRVVIPFEDAQRHDVIIGTPFLRVAMMTSWRDKGPLFIVYPFDRDPALKDLRYYERSIWQLKAIDVE